MKSSKLIAVVGAVVTMVFAFANLGMYLIGGSNPQWAVFVLLMLIALAVGALPGLTIGWLMGKRSDGDENRPS